MTVADPFPELTREIEHRYHPGLSLAGELSVTGQPYVEMSVDCFNQSNLLATGLGLFERYAENLGAGTLYWGDTPVIERVRVGKRHAFRVRMRLLISDNPVVQRLVKEAEQAVADEAIAGVRADETSRDEWTNAVTVGFDK